jgi:hypothetical protein
MKKLFLVEFLLLTVFASRAAATTVMLQQNRPLILTRESFGLLLFGTGLLGLAAAANRWTFFLDCASRIAKSFKIGATHTADRAIYPNPKASPKA